MKLAGWITALIVSALLCEPTGAAQTVKVIVVTGPTVIAFFPPVTEKDLSDDPDTNESLSDFQLYARRVRGKLQDAGIDFQEIYASSFRVECGADTKIFRPQKEQVGYYFAAPAKSPHIEYGVMTDTDVLHVAHEYFRFANKQGSAWRTFLNRAGWSMNYPADWTIASCHSCTDPTAPNVYVDFFPPRNREAGLVMVERLADQPSSMSIDEWLTNLKETTNQNPRLREERFTLNGLPALRVRYRNANEDGHEMEMVYVISRGLTFAISFSAEGGGIPLESLGNYGTYMEMLKTFKGKG